MSERDFILDLRRKIREASRQFGSFAGQKQSLSELEFEQRIAELREQALMSSCCKTRIEDRKVVFGDGGFIRVRVCECEATKLALKYSNTRMATK